MENDPNEKLWMVVILIIIVMIMLSSIKGCQIVNNKTIEMAKLGFVKTQISNKWEKIKVDTLNNKQGD